MQIFYHRRLKPILSLLLMLKEKRKLLVLKLKTSLYLRHKLSF
jgi:hypothetical protein